jgi:hypothetical protein
MKLRDAMEIEKLRTMSNSERLELRARNAVAQWFVRTLIVPNVFFEAQWTDDTEVDLVAIDRAGSGDVHVVEIMSGAKSASIRAAIRQLLNIRANYLWIAFVQNKNERPMKMPSKLLYPYRGMGRIGLIRVEHNKDDQLPVRIETKAERFPGSYYESADRFRSAHKPDIEFR